MAAKVAKMDRALCYGVSSWDLGITLPTYIARDFYLGTFFSPYVELPLSNNNNRYIP